MMLVFFIYLFISPLWLPLQSAVRATLAAESVGLSRNLLMFLFHSLTRRLLSVMRPRGTGSESRATGRVEGRSLPTQRPVSRETGGQGPQTAPINYVPF